MKDYCIYYNNNFVRQINATLPVLSASTQFGLNVFEGIRVYKEDLYYIFRLEDHLKRVTTHPLLQLTSKRHLNSNERIVSLVGHGFANNLKYGNMSQPFMKVIFKIIRKL